MKTKFLGRKKIYLFLEEQKSHINNSTLHFYVKLSQQNYARFDMADKIPTVTPSIQGSCIPYKIA